MRKRNQTDICKEYNIPKSTLSKILKSRIKLEDFVKKTESRQQKKNGSSKYEASSVDLVSTGPC